jgi:hypothetical protein
LLEISLRRQICALHRFTRELIPGTTISACVLHAPSCSTDYLGSWAGGVPVWLTLKRIDA